MTRRWHVGIQAFDRNDLLMDRMKYTAGEPGQRHQSL